MGKLCLKRKKERARNLSWQGVSYNSSGKMLAEFELGMESQTCHLTIGKEDQEFKAWLGFLRPCL